MKKTLLTASILFLAGIACAADYGSGYIERLHDLDQQLICAISWFVAPVTALMLLGGGLLMMTEDPGRKSAGKGLVKNALLGMLLVFCFFLVSFALMPTLTLSVCF